MTAIGSSISRVLLHMTSNSSRLRLAHFQQNRPFPVLRLQTNPSEKPPFAQRNENPRNEAAAFNRTQGQAMLARASFRLLRTSSRVTRSGRKQRAEQCQQHLCIDRLACDS